MKWLAYESIKLSRFLEGKLEGYSGKFIRRMLEANLCRVNGKIERFASKMLDANDLVELSPAFHSIGSPKLNSIKTLFDQDAFRVVNKPIGFVSTDQNIQKVFGGDHSLVHRLDVGTTGLLILAKGKKAKEKFIDLFKRGLVKKKYLAIVDGIVMKDEGTIQSYFVKKGSYHGQTIWGSNPYKGLLAITKYRTLERGKKASLLEIEPVTGRTHQIRVHMAEIGHPILVDPQYARKYISEIISTRPLLHAYELKFVFDEIEVDLKAPLPEDFQKLLESTFKK